MVDSVGTTRYTYDAAGQLLTEDGPFTSDTVTNTYSNRQRVALSLQQPTGVWTNGFGWDLAGRLTNVTSPAGAFGYTYTALDSGFSGRLVQQLGLPSGAYITNFYDPVARRAGHRAREQRRHHAGCRLYGYNAGNQRTAYTNAAGAYVHYTYDPIGQLKVANSSTTSEDRGYAYDAAWNLNYRTNNGARGTFLRGWQERVDQRARTRAAGIRRQRQPDQPADIGATMSYEYDDENRLSAVQVLLPDGPATGPAAAWRTRVQVRRPGPVAAAGWNSCSIGHQPHPG